MLLNLTKGGLCILFFALCVGCYSEVKDFDSGLHVADSKLFSSIAKFMDEQNIEFDIRKQTKEIEYILFNGTDVFEVRKLVQTLQGAEGGIEYRGLCKSNIDDRNAILGDFVENKIDHMMGVSDLGHCIYWSVKDTSKVLMYIDVYRDIVNSKQIQA